MSTGLLTSAGFGLVVIGAALALWALSWMLRRWPRYRCCGPVRGVVFARWMPAGVGTRWCGYDLGPAVVRRDGRAVVDPRPSVCPACGRGHERVRSLRRWPVHGAGLTAGLVGMVVGGAVWWSPMAAAWPEWEKAAPTSVLLFVPLDPTHSGPESLAVRTIRSRIAAGTVWGWQRRVLAPLYADELERTEARWSVQNSWFRCISELGADADAVWPRVAARLPDPEAASTLVSIGTRDAGAEILSSLGRELNVPTEGELFEILTRLGDARAAAVIATRVETHLDYQCWKCSPVFRASEALLALSVRGVAGGAVPVLRQTASETARADVALLCRALERVIVEAGTGMTLKRAIEEDREVGDEGVRSGLLRRLGLIPRP